MDGYENAVEPVIDQEFVKSWDGIKLAAEMRKLAADPDASDGDKLSVLIDYYSRCVGNLDEVVESLGGGSVDASVVFAYLNAHMAAQSKN